MLLVVDPAALAIELVVEPLILRVRDRARVAIAILHALQLGLLAGVAGL
jgi:hypothetical protein